MTNTAHLTELGHSPDALAQRQAELLALLRQTAPEVLSDNQINVEKLKELLGQERIAPAEHYELNWAGKTEARREIQKTSSHTLRPDADNPASAPHMLIEGENLEVLRVLQKSYYGKVKMIYIDPPYNTGNDSFVYPDDYSETLEEYQKRTGEKNADGYLNKQSLWKKNSKESGQFHSAWLSMMYPRLYLARNLLREDGVIFVSIDNHEQHNLRLLLDEIYGQENLIENYIWESTFRPDNSSKIFRENAQHVVAYAKNKTSIKQLVGSKDGSAGLPSLTKNSMKESVLTFPASTVKTGLDDGLYMAGLRASGYELLDDVSVLNGVIENQFRLKGRVIWGQDYLEQQIATGTEILIKSDGFVPYSKKPEDAVLAPTTLIPSDRVGDVLAGRAEINALLGRPVFNHPKPITLIAHFIKFHEDTDGVILDFFAGSGTTAHAVMELNAQDGRQLQTISVQMPEILDGDSEAYKAGYRTIADITRARIAKVITKLKGEHPEKTADLACAHFTLAPSNFKVWRGDVGSADALREQLALFQSAEKGSPSTGAGQTDAVDAQTAMLAELLLKHGLGALGVHAVSAPKQVAGVTVHRVLMPDDKAMWLCFDTYTDALKDEIVKAQPAQVVMLNSCFVGDKADEQLSNLQLELGAPGRYIGLTVI